MPAELDANATRRTNRWPTVVLPTVLTVAAVLFVVPFSVFWADVGQNEAWSAWSLWFSGTAITIGISAVLALVSHRAIHGWLTTAWVATVGRLSTPVFLMVFGGLFACLTLLFTKFVAFGNPRNVDGFAQLFQARFFLEGRLWAEPPPELAHFATLHMVLGPDKWLSQFPPGQPLLLAVALAAGAWWLLNPILAGLLLVVTYRVASWTAGESVGRLAAILLCLSPFAVGVAGTEMNHLPAATLGIGAGACATFIRGSRGTVVGIGTGLLLGLMTAFRPLDAVAAAVPVAFIVWQTSPRRVLDFSRIFVGGVLGTLPTLWYNSATTGSWFEFGYTHLWGPQHSLGFHDVPFGTPLTLLRAIGIASADLYEINRFLFDAPLPILLFVLVAYLTGRRLLRVGDSLPILGVGTLMFALFFYWHRDILFGPRLLYSAVPWMVVLTARSVHLLRHTTSGIDRSLGQGSGATVFAVAVTVGLLTLAPTRLQSFRESTPTFNYHPDRDAARAGLTNAVVVIPDGWGSRLIARMWAAGVEIPRATRLYGEIDACTLHHALNVGEVESLDAMRLTTLLDSLSALHRPGVRGEFTADENLRLPVGPSLPVECVDELNFDRAGFIAYAPYLHLNAATLDGDIVWARDMRTANDDLRRRYPTRRIFRYLTDGPQPRFVELDVIPPDSVAR